MTNSSVLSFPPSLESLRKETLQSTLLYLRKSYSSEDHKQFTFCPLLEEKTFEHVGTGSAAWIAVERVLLVIQEIIVPGVFVHSKEGRKKSGDLEEALAWTLERLHSVLMSFFRMEKEGERAVGDSALSAMNLISQIPKFRERACWNIFASLKDPAVWDAFVLRHEQRRQELGNLDLISIIDEAIQARDPAIYQSFLKEAGFDYTIDYQRRLVERAYPGWRALLMHDIAHALALGGIFAKGKAVAGPVPILPRIISEQAASLYQTDLHPETVIGDANFLEHPHRGITTGQTGRIGIGCVIYPCTLGGITDKVKPRHPSIGDFVLIGTDVGIFGPVSVANHSVIGANTEINGMVEIGENVKIRAAVVARTVISESGKPGKIIFSEGVTVGEECLVVNDHPTDLIIPPGSSIPAGTQVVNDGNGNPRMG